MCRVSKACVDRNPLGILPIPNQNGSDALRCAARKRRSPDSMRRRCPAGECWSHSFFTNPLSLLGRMWGGRRGVEGVEGVVVLDGGVAVLESVDWEFWGEDVAWELDSIEENFNA